EVGRADAYLAAAYLAASAAHRAATAVTPPDPELTSSAEARLRGVLADVRAVPGLERFLLPTSADDLLRASHVAGVVYVVSAPNGTFLLTVEIDTQDQPVYGAVHVPEVTSRDVAAVVAFDIDEGQPGLLVAQQLNDGGVCL